MVTETERRMQGERNKAREIGEELNEEMKV
jgi:hypothetical protein